MLEKNVNNLELKLRIIESEIRENEREKEKCWDNVLGIITAFVCVLGVGSYYLFTKKKEIETLAVIIGGILLLLCLFFGPYWYNKYQKKKKTVEELKRELARLKKGLKE